MPVLVLDVDGTLYEDACQIESQIRDNCHSFALERFGLNSAQCETMHEQWGATIRGIVQGGQPRLETYARYYNQVYPHLDMGRLRRYSGLGVEPDDGASAPLSGYSHGGSRSALRALLGMSCPVVVASNSPVFHVQRVLARLGLARLKVGTNLTPTVTEKH